MNRINKKKLLAGVIFGDYHLNEYLYLPAGEVCAEKPLCVLEQGANRLDLDLPQALKMIEKLALRPVKHPLLGFTSF